MQRWLIIHKSVNVIYYIDKMQGKHCVIISIDAEKALNKIQLMIKNPQQSGYRENMFKHKKAIYDKSITSIILNGEN